MKKKFLFVTIIAVLACALLLVGCNPNGNGNENENEDKSFANTEFVGYRKKIVKILKDSGIFVNDIDSKAKSNVNKVSNSVAMDTDIRLASSETVGGILTKPEYAVDAKDYEFALKQAFGISLRTSLCVGDGLSNYFNETAFFNIPVKTDANTYMQVTENGNVNTVYSYSENSGTQYDKIDVTFRSDNDYEFTVISINEESKYFWKGNSAKEFFMMQIGSGADAIYSPNGQDFYATQEEGVVNDCLEVLGQQIFQINTADFTKMKSEFRYSFSEQQLSDLTDKYFKDVQNTLAPREKGIRYEEIGGKQVAIEYIADGERTVEIPSEVRYFSNQFRVYDMNGAVTGVVIPASVEAFIDSEGNEVSEIQQIHFTLQNHNEPVRLFSEITVKEGSPLFVAGSGTLMLKESGLIVAIIDRPMTGLDFHLLAAAARLEENGKPVELYKLEADSVEIQTSAFADAVQKYGISEERLKEDTAKVLNYAKPSVIEMILNADGANFTLSMQLKKDLRINVTSPDTVREQDFVATGLEFTNATQEKRKVEVYVAESAAAAYVDVGPKQPFHEFLPDDPSTWEKPAYVSDETVFTTFHMDIAQDLYEFLYVQEGKYLRLTRDEKNSAVEFEKESQYSDAFQSLSVVNLRENRAAVRLKDTAENGLTVTVPARFYQYEIIALELECEKIVNKNLTVVLRDGLEITLIPPENSKTVVADNLNFRLKFGGAFDDLKGKLSYYFMEGEIKYDLRFTAECEDKTDVMEIGWAYNSENPDNYDYQAAITYNGQRKTLKFPQSDASVNVSALWDLDDNHAYYLVSDTDKLIFVNFYGDTVEFQINVEESTEYTLCAMELGRKTVRISDPAEEYDLNLTYEILKWDGNVFTDAVITGGTVLGYPVYIEERELPDFDDTLNSLNGVRFQLFFEFPLLVGENEMNAFSINVNIIPDGNGGLKLVYANQMRTHVEVELCDGTVLSYDIRMGQGIPFDETTWKLESGYAYYLEDATNEYSHYSLDVSNGSLALSVANLRLKRVRIAEETPFSFSEDGLEVTGFISVVKSLNGDYCYELRISCHGTVDGQPTEIDTFVNIWNLQWETEIFSESVFDGDEGLLGEDILYGMLKLDVNPDGSLEAVRFTYHWEQIRH